MSYPKQFTIEPADAGNRLDKFLTVKLPDTTRSQIQKLIKTGHATVNGKTAAVHHFLKAGDVVAVSTPATVSTAAAPIAAPSSSPTPTIIYEDAEMLVIEKPAGLLVHATTQKESDTLIAWLQARYPDFVEIGGDPQRPGIVHRLDRDVSGLMVIAKTQAAYDHLVAQFSDRKVRKTYAAIVYGAPTKPAGEITLPIGRSASGKFVAHPQQGGDTFDEKDRDAHTRYRVVETFGRYCLLEVHIATGRPHQIRVHLAAIGHPIVGDREYGPSKPFHHTGVKKVKTVALDRLLLHVTGLTFMGPDGTLHSFTSPLPKIFTTFTHDNQA
ncbi:MAG: RluA family pseudouridine synthase [Patescibacteria group bacterium]|nr:RluA family pseudouridine synthase [Patescibacteria group bacterium]